MAAKLGILAGSGELPRRVIEACRLAGRPFFVLAFEDAADPSLVADLPHAWVRLGAAAKSFRLLRENAVEEVLLAGGVKRPSLRSLRPDWRAAIFFARVGLRALGDDGLLRGVIKEIESEGFKVVGVDTVLSDALAPTGPLGAHRPDAQAEADIAHGVAVARALGALDIGQAVVVQQGIVLGVEAIEGTDALIARCAALKRAGPGGVLVKMAKPGQERRADLPAIGPATVAAVAASGLRGIAVEAGAALVLDRTQLVAAADRAGIFILGIAPP